MSSTVGILSGLSEGFCRPWLFVLAIYAYAFRRAGADSSHFRPLLFGLKGCAMRIFAPPASGIFNLISGLIAYMLQDERGLERAAVTLNEKGSG